MQLRKIKNIISSEERKTVFKNFLSLSFLQFATYVLPLITLPYLVRILGPEKFGLISFSQAFIRYFILITDFGFNLSATREISINRSRSQKVMEIFISVFIIKLVLTILSFSVILVLVFTLERFNIEHTIYLLTSIAIIGWALFPQWYFQGIENMRIITLINVISKLLFTVAVFVFVANESDYKLVALLNSAGILFSGIVSFMIALKSIKVRIVKPEFSQIKHQFIEGWHIFVSNISINLYTTSNSVLLGFLTNNIIVGYYTGAERIFTAVQQLGMPLFQSLFPYFSKLISESKEQAIKLFNKLFRYTMIITFILAILLSIFSADLIKLILGDGYASSIQILTILSWVIFASWGNYILGIQGLVNFGYKEIFSKIVFYSGMGHIVFAFLGIYFLGYIAVPVIWFFTESFIFSMDYYYLRKLKIVKSIK